MEVDNKIKAYRKKLKDGQNPDEDHIDFLHKQPPRHFFEVSARVVLA